MVKICGSVHAAIMLCYVKGRCGWFRMTQKEWENATGLSRCEQESCRFLLRNRGFISEELRGIPACLHFLVHTDRINDALCANPHGSPPRRRQFVYLMKNKLNGFVKIGVSTNPTQREKTLQSEEPDIDMFFSEASSMKIEKELHKHFAHKRARGEWFKLTDDDVSYCVSYITENSNK
jgi:hypothetical protein